MHPKFQHLVCFPGKKQFFAEPIRTLHTWEELHAEQAKKQATIVALFEYGAEPALTAFVYEKELGHFEPPSPFHVELHPTWTRTEYEQAFNRIKDYIASGDIYQMNLTYFFEGSLQGQPQDLFQYLWDKNPAEMSAYVDLGAQQILSCSPERFISLKGSRLQTCPVKGTRPRGQTPQEDAEQKRELVESEKEAAELNMITDLLRNDLGKISKTGTVQVKEQRSIQENPSVFHTYSVIESELQTQLTAVDVLRSCLPGGSISGCPKKRACEIIQELEAKPRGFYTGVLAVFSPSGDMDSSILIRTLVHKDGKLSLGVGGGIVADSQCQKEFEETLHKASPFTNLP